MAEDMQEPRVGAVKEMLAGLGTAVRDDFTRNRRVLSYAEYLELVLAEPLRQLRSSTQYIVDALDHYGSSDVKYPWGSVRRFHMFDAPWANGEDRLFGQEHVQNAVYRVLRAFVQDGRPNKLILLHGPNGSAKSTFIRCLGRGLENYSTLDEGALYRFSWIFPAARHTRSGIGFGGKDAAAVEAMESFAYLPDDLIDARVGDELRDHPLLLIPLDERAKLITKLLDGRQGSFNVCDYLRGGSLAPKNRAIYDALLASYQGDYLQVLRHVRVERFEVSQRYRQGWVTVEPQLSVDASERQITADRTLGALPPSLQSVSLHEYGGEVVGANRGLIEFDDLLKRPLEHYKYLLTTVERAALSLTNSTLFLDLVFLGSCNDIHLAAFREIPDFQSFKGRIELVRLPYILDVRHEELLYRERLREAAGGRHVAPHTAYVAALWAVLSRMRKPQVERYPSTLAEVMGKLSPVDKVELYSTGQLPDDLTPDRARELAAHIKDLYHESDTYPIYEGRVGASPREMQGVLLAAAGSTRYPYVSPLVVLDEIIELCKQTTLYEFLRQDVQPGGYHDHKKLVDVARARLLDRIDDEVRASVGLVEESEYSRVFDRYVNHVMHHLKKEKVRETSTGRMLDPDETMMREVERTLELTGRPEDFRQSLIAKIGAWSLDHRGQKPVLAVIFADLLRKLRDAYFERHKKTIAKGITDLVLLLSDNAGGLSAEGRTRAEGALETLIGKYGYTRESARDLVGALATLRYRS
ncbi:MAG: serine protein kinase PrkA [Deltaproteobacteria bacterium]|nr:serine protein kinase PrkA [Deltaproteobacteria bacterium]MCW5808254.1 serine protein kinase PrkA [Deltaproteobacteria bacterium]